ncbi:hypothetical protein BCAMP_04130 [Brochothrix campestris FSL F6-1037]|uniref:Uncharacterized protein n=1 Tax=Brochothrix campestris FSL F6-1037 TaxID=1265861 RepID=W7CW50_9LIST|nr:hypothetical protein BCAMP_04130 [Brochothrix campestris FSL F6-1037]
MYSLRCTVLKLNEVFAILLCPRCKLQRAFFVFKLVTRKGETMSGDDPKSHTTQSLTVVIVMKSTKVSDG